ncbi:DUF2339 domain-containing protein, partial [bacterium]|nr:DUF2339 domain-containing protein [bacterium]
FNAYLTKGVVVLTLGLAYRYSRETLTAWLALEMVVLLLSAARSGLLVNRLLALGLGVIAFFHGLSTVVSAGSLNIANVNLDPEAAQSIYETAGYAGQVFQAVLAILAFFFCSRFYASIDWRKRTSEMPGFAFLQQALDGDCMKSSGKSIPAAYAWGGSLFLLIYALDLAEPGHRSLAIAAAGLVLLIASVGFRFASFQIWALRLTALAALWAIFLESGGRKLTLDLGAVYVLLVTAAGVFSLTVESGRDSIQVHHLPVRLASRMGGIVAALILPLFFVVQIWKTRQFLPLGPEWMTWAVLAATLISAIWLEGFATGWRNRFVRTSVSQDAIYRFCLYLIAAFFLGRRLLLILPNPQWPIGLTIASGVCAAAFLILDKRALSTAALILASWAVMAWMPRNWPSSENPPMIWLVAGGLLIALPLAMERLYVSVGREKWFRAVGGLAIFLAWGVALRHVNATIDKPWVFAGYSGVACAFLAFGTSFRSNAATILSGLGAVFLSIHLCLHVLPPAWSGNWVALVASFTILGVYWIVVERLFSVCLSVSKRLSPSMFFWTGLVWIALAAYVFVVFFQRLPHVSGISDTWITIGWFGLAVALFLVSLAFREKQYRYVGLAAIVLSLGRVLLVDMKSAPPALRIAAFALMGTGLLAISYGYFKFMDRFGAQKESASASPEQSRHRD